MTVRDVATKPDINLPGTIPPLHTLLFLLPKVITLVVYDSSLLDALVVRVLLR